MGKSIILGLLFLFFVQFSNAFNYNVHRDYNECNSRIKHENPDSWSQAETLSRMRERYNCTSAGIGTECYIREVLPPSWSRFHCCLERLRCLPLVPLHVPIRVPGCERPAPRSWAGCVETKWLRAGSGHQFYLLGDTPWTGHMSDFEHTARQLGAPLGLEPCVDVEPLPLNRRFDPLCFYIHLDTENGCEHCIQPVFCSHSRFRAAFYFALDKDCWPLSYDRDMMAECLAEPGRVVC